MRQAVSKSQMAIINTNCLTPRQLIYFSVAVKGKLYNPYLH